MPNFICLTCGTQFAETNTPPDECKICIDDRQYVGWQGQQWTTLSDLRQTDAADICRWCAAEALIRTSEYVPVFEANRGAVRPTTAWPLAKRPINLTLTVFCNSCPCKDFLVPRGSFSDVCHLPGRVDTTLKS